VDICVCDAGVSRPKPFLELTAEDWDATLRINLGGTFLVGQAAAKAIVTGGRRGSIINMPSINAVLTTDTIAPYCASKGGVNQLTKAMAVGLAQHGIRVDASDPVPSIRKWSPLMPRRKRLGCSFRALRLAASVKPRGLREWH
jgi:NAD(P)-dependent dehydrogenase (short-subunit alcohol dehydrogenase family)